MKKKKIVTGPYKPKGPLKMEGGPYTPKPRKLIPLKKKKA